MQLATEAAIRLRRTHKKFTGAPVAPEVLKELIELATLAPNHRLTNPWRFYVLEQDALARLGNWLPYQQEIVASPDPAKGPAKIAKLTGHYFPQLGAMIVVTSRRNGDALLDKEDYAACAAACQNILLAATARGLASFWASSPALRHVDTLRWYGADPAAERFVGALWLGTADDQPSAPPRRPAAELTRWL